ncbi:MAG: lipase family protein [Synechocystis sp.]|nr:lipase family protein [Synechocystis sp.]
MKTVEPYQTKLHSGTAYWMARLAQMSYVRQTDDAKPDEVTILDKLKQEDSKFLDVQGFSKKSSQAILAVHEDYYCFAFRGTDQSIDWLDNLNAFPYNVLFGEFHRGFWNAVGDIWEELFEAYLERRKTHKKPLFLTGHSLGGAMATVASAKLIQMDWPFISTYTFGQPRAMTLDTSRKFDVYAGSRFFRFQNNNDIVTRAPARAMNYSHVGSFIYISQEKELSNEPGFWYRFLDGVDGAFESFRQIGRFDLVADHQMEDYLEAINAWNWVD